MINLICCSKDMNSRNYEKKLYNFKKFDFENFLKNCHFSHGINLRWGHKK